jgi:iron complex outermembrane receptor protein
MATACNARLIRALMIGSAAAALGAGASFAQTAPPPADQGANTLQEIVVTARKKEENVQTTPLAMTALNANMLQKAQINSVNDLGTVVPSLLTKIEPSVGSSSTIALRGFVDTNPTNLLGDGPVALYVDGVYMGRDTGNTVSLVDLSRVEVEAGPQGTLFGRNVTGGAISLYTKPPAKTFGMEEKLSYGSFNDVLTRTTVDTGELGDTGFYAKLAYMHHQNEGYGVTNTLAPKKADNPGAANENFYYFALHGTLGPKITVDYKFDWASEHDQSYSDQTIGGSAAFVALHGHPLSGTPFPILGTPGPGGTIEVQPNFMSTVAQSYVGPNIVQTGGHALTVNYEVNDDISLKSITAYRSVSQFAIDNFGGNGNQIGLNLNPATGAVTPGPLDILYTKGGDNNQYQLSEELQLNGKFDRFTYVAGLYYFDEHVGQNLVTTHATFPLFLAPGVAAAIQVGDTVNAVYDGEAASRAGYFDTTYKPAGFDDKLELSAGIRYTWDTKSIDQSYGSIRPGFDDYFAKYGLPDVRKRNNYFNIAGSGAIKYQWTPAVMTYLRVGNSYRAGGFNPENSSTGAGANSFAPEGVLSWETGIKSDWLDHHLRINADVYYTDYTGMQVNLVGSSQGFSSFTGNAGRARMIGFETQFTILPADGWQMDGSLGIIAPKFLQYQEVQGIGAPNLASIAEFQDLPDTTASADLQYSFKPMPAGDLTLRVDWSFRSRTYSGIDPSTSSSGLNGIAGSTPGFSPYTHQGSAPPFHDVGAEITLANIPVNFHDSTLEVEVYGKNLLDKHDVLLSTDIISGLGFANEAWGPGRTFGVMLLGKF